MIQKPNLDIMRAAIEVAELNGTPFGATLAMGDEVFITAANQTKELNDPTAHAEILAIRNLCESLNKTDLSGFTLYSTCEPCSVCMSAAIGAKINTVFYGCNIPIIKQSVDQTNLRAHKLAKFSFSNVHVKGGIRNKECSALLRKYS